MTGKVAVAVIHGIGTQKAGFEADFRRELHEYCTEVCGRDITEEIVIRGVHWAPVVDEAQQALNVELRDKSTVKARFPWTRHKLLTFASDAIAYRSAGTWVYDKVHSVFAHTLKDLAESTAPNAPLVVIAHSLGTIIASNFLYDLEYAPLKDYPLIAERTRAVMGESPTPLEQGQTLSYLFTLGSPISMFSIVYEPPDRGQPISVPSQHLIYEDGILPDDAGWYNYYDKHDIIGFPIRPLSLAYEQAVKEDEEIGVGNFITGITPLSHTGYFDSRKVIQRIGDRLFALVKAIDDGKLALETRD
jgi:hypothetical protein